MSADLNKILEKMSFRNEQIMKPVNQMAMGMGINIKYDTGMKDPLKLISVLVFLASLSCLSSQYLYIWNHRFEPFTVYIDAISASSQVLISLIIMVHVFLNQRQFQKLSKKVLNSEILQDFELLDLNILNKKQIIQDIQSILNDSWLDVKRQLNIFFTGIWGTIGWYYISCLVINFYNIHFTTREFEVVYPLKSAFPFWQDKGMRLPYYAIKFLISGSGNYIAGCGIYVNQVKYFYILIFLISLLAAVSLTCPFFANTVHAMTLIKILRRLIDNSTTENVLPEDRVKYVVAWSRLYQRIYEYYYEINSLYFIQSAPLFLVSMLVMCLLIFQCSVDLETDADKVVGICIFLSTVTFQIFIFCINGQRLTTECEKLSTAIYSTNWYDQSNEFKVLIHMMIMRTNRIFELEIGGFLIMSRVTFLGIMRSSFSFFLLLKDVNNE